jgi:phage/plasmid-like protein (TIGR03299 family)
MARDVNADLYNQRAGTAYDRAEYAGRDGLALTNTGEAMLATTTPAWHDLGWVNPTGEPMDIDTVLEKSHLDFDVNMQAAMFTNPITGRFEQIPGLYDSYRTDTGVWLGRIGADYTLVGNRPQFRHLQHVARSYGAVFESAGMLKGGRVFVSLEMPEPLVARIPGGEDHAKLFLMGVNSFNGTSKFADYVTPWRPVCSNTERWGRSDALVRWERKHTARIVDDVDDARRTMNLVENYRDEWARTTRFLARVDMDLAEFDALLSHTALDQYAEDELTHKQERNFAARRNQLRDRFAVESNRVGQNRLAAGHAIADYYDHLAPIAVPKTMTEEIARGLRITGGDLDQRKNQAFKLLLTTNERIQRRR